MDMDSLRFGYAEHFDTFDSFLSLSEDDSQSTEGALNESNSNYWEWDREEELNGDVAVIPTSYYAKNEILDNSPPVKEDFQKIMNDWQQLINFETADVKDFVMDIDMVDSAYPLDEQLDQENPIKDVMSSSFDLPDFINGQNTTVHKNFQHGGKKIDLKAQCYVVDEKEENKTVNQTEEKCMIKDDGCVEEDHVDVETISEHKLSPPQSPVLEAQDMGSLLEEFEAKIDQIAVNHTMDVGLKESETRNIQNSDCPEKSKAKGIVTAVELNQTVEGDRNINSELAFSKTGTTNNSNSQQATVPNDNKHIINNLPTELIKRIKASSKRRSIAVIDAVPNTKRIKTLKNSAKVTNQQESNSTSPNPTENHCPSPDWIHLDHDYCGSLSPYSKYPKKDSGFASGEEEDHRNILKNQPTVKRADGKLMVSLLKVNTIKRNTETMAEVQKKRKLNLEEYKKRREGILKSYENSQNNSPLSSGRCSPTIEDENIRRLKHQEKLLQMAADLLKSSPKSKQNENNKSVVTPSSVNNFHAENGVKKEKTEHKSDVKVVEEKISSEKAENDSKNVKVEKIDTDSSSPKSNKNEQCNQDVQKTEKCEKVEDSVSDEQINVPPNFIAKTIISIGINTECTQIPFKKSKQMDVPPIKQLEEIKPILKNASAKISSNSLIASVIENIQNKVKSSMLPICENIKKETEEACGEDKTIVFLPKDRAPVQTRDAETQTNHTENLPNSLEDGSVVDKDTKCKSSRKEGRQRSREQSRERSSRSSSNDSYSHSSRSSRSGSISPQRLPLNRKRPFQVNKDHLRAVEERRIVYVGGISSRTTREDLRRRFQRFGPITNVSIHFRDYGDNYGFVTFLYNVDAYEAVEHGNDDPTLPRYDLSFGGRRIFCRTRYSDLDNIREDVGYPPSRKNEESFDNLLREMQAKLCKRKAAST